VLEKKRGIRKKYSCGVKLRVAHWLLSTGWSKATYSNVK